MKGDNGMPCDDITVIVEDSLGNLWAKNAYAKYIIKIDPTTNKIRTFTRAERPVVKPCGKLPEKSLMFGDWQNLCYTIEGDSFMVHEIVPLETGDEFLAITEHNTILRLRNKTEVLESDLAGNILKKNTVPVPVELFYAYTKGWGHYLKTKFTERVFFVDTSLQVNEITSQLPPVDTTTFDVFFYTGLDDIIWRQGKIWSLRNGLIRDLGKEGVDNRRPQQGPVVADKGKIWYTSAYGAYLVTITPNKFKKYFDKTNEPFRSYAFRGLQLVDSTLYMSMEDSGIYTCNINSNNKTLKKIYSNNYDAYSGMIRAHNGNIITARRSSIYETDIHSGITKAYQMAKGDATNSWALYEISDHKLLLGMEEGLSWLNMENGVFSKFTQYNNYDELRRAFVTEIIPDKHGLVFFCANSGLYEFDNRSGVTKRYSASDTGSGYLPARSFQSLYRDKDDIYWLATTSGLIRWDRAKHHYKLYTRGDGLSNNNIYAVYEDKHSRLWLSSDYGIMQFSKADEHVICYLPEDGISNTEFNRISHLQDSSGNIYFGSLTGITEFNPEDFPVYSKNDSSGAPLAITSFMQFDGDKNALVDKTTDLMKTGAIYLYDNDRFFTIAFSLLNFDTKYTLYYWKIDGVDSRWNIQRDRNIRLSRLPYGQMLLRIKAQAANGAWSRNELRIVLNVVRPFYLRTWFIVTALIVFIGMIVVAYRWRLYRLRKENIRLDRVVAEKTIDLQISLDQKVILLKEIHHRVKNNLQVISSLLRLQSRSVTDESARSALLDGQNRVVSIALIHQKLYQDADLEKVEFSRFAEDLFQHLSGVYEKADDPVRFSNTMNELYFNIDIAVPLALILNELITNSFKYAFYNNPSPKITLTQEQRNGHRVLVYADNGPGLPKNIDPYTTRSMGLRLINRLATQINGIVKYDYRSGFHCTIEIHETAEE